MNDYDRTSRRAAKLDPYGFFCRLFVVFAQHLRFERRLDTRTVPFPGDPERIGDTVAEMTATATAPAWAVPVEFQTEPDPDMFGRLMIFLGSLRLQMRQDESRGSRYQLSAAVVNLTGTPSSAPASRDYVFPGAAGVYRILNVREVYLQVEPADELLRRIRSGEWSRALLVWIPLMQTDDPSGIIAQWIELALGEPDEKLRAEYGALAKVFARLSAAKGEWLQALEGWNVTTSPFLDEIRAEGRLEGRLEGRAEAILQLLQLRFKVLPGSDVVNRLRQVNDLDRLSHWFDVVAAVNSYEELLGEWTRS